METISSVNENSLEWQMTMYDPSSVQLVNMHIKIMGRGDANSSLVCTFPQVNQTDCRMEQVKPTSCVKENEFERVIMDNSSSKKSPILPFQMISGQCSFQQLSWNNLQWVDELDAKDIWENVETSGRAITDVNVGTTKLDSEVLEMDVICHTRKT